MAVEFWQEVGADLDMIKEEVERQLRETELEMDLDGFEHPDTELEEALRRSQEEWSCGPSSRGIPTPSSSPPKASRRRSDREDVIMVDDSDEDDQDLYSYPLPRVRASPPPRRSRTPQLHNGVHDMQLTTSNDEDRLKKRSNKSSSKADRSKPILEAKSKTPSQMLGASGIDQILSRGSLGQRSSVPTSDMIDGDL